MLDVSAICSIITNHWTGNPINKKSIIETCLFHDIAKPVTFDPKKQSAFASSQEEVKSILYLISWLKKTYGTEEHHVLRNILTEIGLNKTTVELSELIDWKNIPTLFKEKNDEALTVIYSDMRVSPKGLVSEEERIIELSKRTDVKNIDFLTIQAKKLEQYIDSCSSISVNDISQDEIARESKRLERLVISNK